MKRYLVIIPMILFALVAFLGYRIISNSHINQVNKADYAEVNHIKYGLFSINTWKDKLSRIVASEIDKLEINDNNDDVLKKQLEGQLGGLIDSVNNRIRESNKGSVGGWFKQRLINAFVDVDEIKKGIPQYAETIIAEVKKDKNQNALKAVLKQKVGQYLNTTFADQDTRRLEQIMAHVGAKSIGEVRTVVTERTNEMRKLIYRDTWMLIFVAGMIFVFAGTLSKPIGPMQFGVLLLTLFCLLLAGVTTPMIDMEAKISEMSFQLFGYPIKFENQVLYFQSKSILDVFHIMVMHPDIQMKVVGILMVAFSILFPLAKLLSSLAFYLDLWGARSSKAVQFFVLKSGKWSMTDVQIVAIFMAYVGFNGIITSQFGNLKSLHKDIVILTTNGTTLQPGFYLFLTYSVLALFMSDFLAKEPSAERAEERKEAKDQKRENIRIPLRPRSPDSLLPH